jgi:hypothetical protein
MSLCRRAAGYDAAQPFLRWAYAFARFIRLVQQHLHRGIVRQHVLQGYVREISSHGHAGHMSASCPRFMKSHAGERFDFIVQGRE